MTKSSIIDSIAQKHPNVAKKSVDYIVNQVFASIKEALVEDDKVEIRGFGSFKVRVKAAKKGRNPKTGETVDVPEKKIPYFKPGKEIKESLLAIKLNDK